MGKRRGNKLDALLTLIPGYDPVATAGNCRFDAKTARDAIEFVEKCCTHVKGELGGKPFGLEPWERAIIANLFGWKRPDGTRRYREALIYVPRKNGKSSCAAAIILLVLMTDHEPGAEIYSCASDRDQAALIFAIVKGMVNQESEFSSRLQIYETGKAVVYPAESSSYKAISAESASKHGYNSQLVIVDELHAQPNRELVDVLQTSTGARRQPLFISITTADFDRPSICNEKHDYACKVRDRVIEDAAFLPVLYEAAVDSDWTDPKVWASCNPNLGVSLKLEYLQHECQRAKETPTFENTFKRLHLNIRTENDVRWIALEAWDANSGAVEAETLHGQPCFGGLDLSSTTDLSAFVLWFPNEGAVLPFFWVPAEGADKRERRDRVPYSTWVNQGHIEATEGNVIDYDVIRERIKALKTVYDIRKIAFDRWAATQLCNQLTGDGLEMVPFGQGFASMSAPTKHLEKLILGKQIKHGANPVLRWMASNITVESDAAGNLKPSKNKSSEKIDGIVAFVMALGLGMAGVTAPVKSVYDTRGPLVFSIR